MFVKPAPRPEHLRAPDQPDHLMVRDPHTGVPLPATGREVPDTDLEWHRLLTVGDIVLAEPPGPDAHQSDPAQPVQE